MTWLVSLMSVFLLCCSCVAGPTTTTCSTSGPATQPAGSGDPRVDAILERLERRGQEVADLSARLTWQLYDQIVEEKYINRGQMLYKRQEPNARFLIRFDEQIMGRRSRPQKKWFIFDGRWYIEASELAGEIHEYEIAPPGKTVDPFRLGQGPFPLPFGQKKADILRYFRVRLVAPAPGDPDKSDHLLLLPISGTDMADDYRKLDFYVDRKLELPIRFRLFHTDDKITTVDFADLAINTGLIPSRFEVRFPKDWPRFVERLPPGPAEPDAR